MSPAPNKSCSRNRRARPGGARAILTLVLLASGCGPDLAREPLPPNLVLIISDDMGFGDHGFMGSEWVRTPQLDRLAAEGMVFRSGYSTSSVCAPALNTLLTGLHPYQWETRVARLERERPSLDRAFAIEHFATLPSMLSEAGYASFQAGKHWEGSRASAGFTSGMTEEYDPEAPWGDLELGRESMEPVFDFIDAHGEVPFLVWFAPRLPHVPHDAPEAFLTLYEAAPLSRAARRYYAACSWFDALVGQLVTHLEKRGLRERTLLVYLSDNGWDQAATAEHRGRIAGFLGGPHGKGSLYDKGFRTPILWNWPGRLPAGRVVSDLVSTVDVVPTLLDYAGVEPSVRLPGRSLRPRIEGHTTAGDERIVGSMHSVRPLTNVLEMLDEDSFFVRTPEFHYILREDRRTEELYDIQSDPDELHDLAPEHPALTAEFRREIERWRADIVREAEVWSPLDSRREAHASR